MIRQRPTKSPHQSTITAPSSAASSTTTTTGGGGKAIVPGSTSKQRDSSTWEIDSSGSWDLNSNDGMVIEDNGTDTTLHHRRSSTQNKGVKKLYPLHFDMGDSTSSTTTISSFHKHNKNIFNKNYYHHEDNYHFMMSSYNNNNIDGRDGSIHSPSSFLLSNPSNLSRAPELIPDSKYQAYLLGKPIKPKGTSMIDKICCANFCFGFSIVGFAFLLFVGIIVDVQPLYIQGVLPEHVVVQSSSSSTSYKKPKTFYLTNVNERLPSASNAYKAAFFYLLTALLCWAYVNNFPKWWFQRRHYHDIPDADSTIPTFHNHHHHDNTTNNSPNIHRYNTNNNIINNNTKHPAFIMAYRYNQRVWNNVGNILQRLWVFITTVSPWQFNRRPHRRKRTASTKDV